MNNISRGQGYQQGYQECAQGALNQYQPHAPQGCAPSAPPPPNLTANDLALSIHVRATGIAVAVTDLNNLVCGQPPETGPKSADKSPPCGLVQTLVEAFHILEHTLLVELSRLRDAIGG